MKCALKRLFGANRLQLYVFVKVVLNRSQQLPDEVFFFMAIWVRPGKSSQLLLNLSFSQNIFKDWHRRCR